MFSRLLPLVLLGSVVLGCSKNEKSPGDPSPVESLDPNASYTIKLREQMMGDKTEVVITRVDSMTKTTANTTQTHHEKLRYEYTETVLEMAPEKPRATKVTRVYKTAERTDPQGEMRSIPCVGKTITIEKFAKGYRCSEWTMPLAEQLEINQLEHMEDLAGRRGKVAAMLPKSAVTVGEEWPVDLGAVRAFTGIMLEYHQEKSKSTGKLTGAHKKDGQQWGVLEWKITMVFDKVDDEGRTMKGQMVSDVTLETPIDGSARAGTIKMTTKGTLDHRDILGHEVKTTIEGVQEQTLTPVK